MRTDNRLILLYKGLKGKARIPTDDLIPKTMRCRNSHSKAFRLPSASVEAYKSKHSKRRRWKSMLIHHGGLLRYIFYTYSIHKVSSLKFAYYSTQYAANTLHQRIFSREAIPSHYFPLREDSSRALAWGLHG